MRTDTILILAAKYYYTPKSTKTYKIPQKKCSYATTKVWSKKRVLFATQRTQKNAGISYGQIF